MTPRGALWLFAIVFVSTTSAKKRPHIIVIVADDLGWNDVGFHGSNQIPTPNIDALAYSGIVLQNYYVNQLCTPSRSALMTGYHPIHTGLQSHVINGAAPYGLPMNFKLMPEYMNDLGYQSVAIGKWHLGSHKEVFTPTKRGFKSHLGYWTGRIDYYDHTAEEMYEEVQGWGTDFRRDMSVNRDDFGKYATDVFTDEAVTAIMGHNSSSPMFMYLAHLAVHSGNKYEPLQAPQDVVDKFNHIQDENRRKYAAMVYKLDESVGKVVDALARAEMLEDSVIVFTTDNGGPAAGYDMNAASNYPLKGTKDTLWEGGTRGAGLLWSPSLESAPRVSEQMMNVQDWLPTLYTAAGGKSSGLPFMDGMDLWKSLSRNRESPRSLFLHNIDETRFIQGLRVGEWKIVKGTTHEGAWDGWYGPSGRNGSYNLDAIRSSPAARALHKIGKPLGNNQELLKLRSQGTVECPPRPEDATDCNIEASICLFNIKQDPCEQNNVAFKFSNIVKLMDNTLEVYQSTQVPRLNKPKDPRSDPKYFNYTWTNWLDYYEDQPEVEEEGQHFWLNDEAIQNLNLFGDY